VRRVAFLVLSTVVACSGRSPIGGGAADAVAAPDAPTGLGPVQKLDLLVVMDDSAGVNEEGWAEVGRALMTFLDELRRSPHGLPDIHLGIVSQDLGAGPTYIGQCVPGGQKGALIRAASCGIAAGERFVTLTEGGARTNASRPLAETLTCLTNVGGAGCGYEHFLAAALRALSGTVPENSGFARPDADLALFIHSDEDDCSAPPDSDFFATPMPMQTGSFRCALAGHRCHGRAIPAAPFEAPFAACDDDPSGGGHLIPVDQAITAARALRPGRRLFVGGVIGRPIPGQDGLYRVTGSPGQLNLSNVCGTPYTPPDIVGTAAPAPRLQRFIATLSGDFGSLCHGPSHHTVARALAARINAAN
jgi:hypothetical protein